MVESLRPIIFPEKSGNYKFVQFQKDLEHYLRFTSEDSVHSQIVVDFLNELDLPLTMDRSDSRFIMPTESDYTITGAGKCELDLANKIAIFYGRSIGYNITTHQPSIDALKDVTDIELVVNSVLGPHD